MVLNWISDGGETMKWDKMGAIKALESGKCMVCGKIKPIYVVFTMHGKKDLHIPCCSDECLEIVYEVILDVQMEHGGLR